MCDGFCTAAESRSQSGDQAASYPLQVLLKDHSRAFQAGLSQPVTTQPEALRVDRHHRRVEVHLANKPQRRLLTFGISLALIKM